MEKGYRTLMSSLGVFLNSPMLLVIDKWDPTGVDLSFQVGFEYIVSLKNGVLHKWKHVFIFVL